MEKEVRRGGLKVLEEEEKASHPALHFFKTYLNL